MLSAYICKSDCMCFFLVQFQSYKLQFTFLMEELIVSAQCTKQWHNVDAAREQSIFVWWMQYTLHCSQDVGQNEENCSGHDLLIYWWYFSIHKLIVIFHNEECMTNQTKNILVGIATPSLCKQESWSISRAYIYILHCSCPV